MSCINLYFWGYAEIYRFISGMSAVSGNFWGAVFFLLFFLFIYFFGGPGVGS